MAALHSIVERKVWRDEKVRALTHAPANAREMWMYLLTCDSQGAFPGLFVLRVSTASDDLDWPMEDTRRILEEIVASGMAEYDAATGVVRLPNALAKRTEQALSERTTKGWRNAFDNLPRCEVARRAFHAAVETIHRARAEAVEAGHKAKDPAAPLKAFVSKPPAWVGSPQSNSGGATEAPSKPLLSSIDTASATTTRATEAPSELHPSPIDAAVAVAVEEAGGVAGVHARTREAPTSPVFGAPFSDGAAAIRSALAKARDLWPATFVSDDELSAAAVRVADEIDEPTNRALGEHYIVATDAIRHARSHGKRFPAVTAESLLARFEEKCGWILGEYRCGKRQRAGHSNGTGVVVDDDFASNAVREMEDLERGHFRTPRGGEPTTVRALLPTGTGGRR